MQELDYINKTIEILEETVGKLKKMQQEASKELEQQHKTGDAIKQIQLDVKQLKDSII